MVENWILERNMYENQKTIKPKTESSTPQLKWYECYQENHSSIKKCPTIFLHRHSPHCIGCKVSADSESEAMCYDLALLENNCLHWLGSAKIALKVLLESFTLVKKGYLNMPVAKTLVLIETNFSLTCGEEGTEARSRGSLVHSDSVFSGLCCTC